MSSAHDQSETSDGAEALAGVVGANLKRLRVSQGYSLERLAALSGVSRAMIGQIEAGKSTPTIALLWKLATALGVPFSMLIAVQGPSATSVLRRDEAKILYSSGGKFTSRALFPFDTGRRVEFYEIHLAPKHVEASPAHAPGTRENLIVVTGAVEIQVGKSPAIALGEGDAMTFLADQPHRYRNLGADEAVIHLVVTYVEEVG